jgi:hypothetical protein
MKPAQKQHKDFKTMIITPEQIEEHNLINDCCIYQRPFTYKNFKVKHHNHFTGKYQTCAHAASLWVGVDADGVDLGLREW